MPTLTLLVKNHLRNKAQQRQDAVQDVPSLSLYLFHLV